MIDTLKTLLANEPGLQIAVLVGSRARDDAHENSDWDIAVKWASDDQDLVDAFARMEELRHRIAHTLHTNDDRIDLIDLARAGLAMRAEVAENGLPLKGEDDLPWFHFLTRTWKELEDWYWEQEHAA